MIRHLFSLCLLTVGLLDWATSDDNFCDRPINMELCWFTHLNKRFLRFGRGEQSSTESGEQIQRVERQGDPYLRFGRQGDPYLRFGRSGEPYLRFGRQGDPYLRFGRQGEPYLRFGRSGEPYLRFGRQGDPYLRFGRQGEPYLRIGRAGEPYLRFGRQGEPYLRFGRSDDDVDAASADVKLEPEGEEDQRAARSERSVGSQLISDLAVESAGLNDAPAAAAARSRRDLRAQHLPADRLKREGYLRFGRDKISEQTEEKEGHSASPRERPRAAGPPSTRDVSLGGSDLELSRQARVFPRWGKRYLRFGRREGYLRFGKREMDS